MCVISNIILEIPNKMLEINNGGGKMENSGWIIVFVGAGILIWVIAAWQMLRGKKSEYKLQEKNSSQGLVALGSTFVVLGIVFGADRLIGYSFIGAGVLLSIIGAIKSRRKEQRSSVEVG
jgi:VIT1/CCC1 family predicted Fe2+/Mn2+ transporter